jgi:hypothetical protein
MPTDYVNGLDFRLKKGSKGGYADYSTSNWSRRTRPLTDIEQSSVSKHGLNNLSSFLPKKPNDVELRVMMEMFEASVDGEAYDAARWGQYFKPAGLNQATGDPTQATQRAPVQSTSGIVETTVVETPVVETTAVETTSSDNRAQDILAMIRSRSQAQ